MQNELRLAKKYFKQQKGFLEGVRCTSEIKRQNKVCCEQKEIKLVMDDGQKAEFYVYVSTFRREIRPSLAIYIRLKCSIKCALY